MTALYVHIETRLKTYMLDVTLEVDNELLALVGPERSGKSIILRAVAGVYVPDTGLISIGDRTVFSTGLDINVPTAERRVGHVPQANAVFSHLTVAENISYLLRRQVPWSDEEVARRVDEVVDLLGLQRVINTRTDDLHAEDRHRIALARALVLDPEVLLLDDPFAELDDVTRRRVRADFAYLRRQIGIPALLTTSELDEGYEVADRIALIDRGHVLQTGTPHHLLHHPANRRVAELVSAVNVIPCRVVRSDGVTTEVETAFGLLLVSGATASDSEADLVIRPEQIQILTDAVDWRALVNVIRGVVHAERQHGATHALEIAVEGYDAWAEGPVILHILLSTLAYQQHGLRVGGPVLIELPPGDLHIMPRSVPGVSPMS
jgi:iron(III) transport system ATP-binding protein